MEEILDSRLFAFFTHTTCVVTRDILLRKARSVTAGQCLINEKGEDAFVAFVNRFYDESIPHLHKPEADRPPRKRALPWTREDSPAKRMRVDPVTVTDQELAYTKCCNCRKRLPHRESCYTNGKDWDLRCLDCAKKECCADCGTIDATIYPPNIGGDGHRCKPCKDQRSPPTVVRIRRNKEGDIVQSCDIYIGRRCFNGGWSLAESPWANPFKIGANCSREDAIAKYEDYVRRDANLMGQLASLSGKRLGCWCSPQACHGDVLVKLWGEEKTLSGA